MYPEERVALKELSKLKDINYGADKGRCTVVQSTAEYKGKLIPGTTLTKSLRKTPLQATKGNLSTSYKDFRHRKDR